MTTNLKSTAAVSRTLADQDLLRFAERVSNAQDNGHTIPLLSEEIPGMNVADGYAIQTLLRHITIGRGARLVGWKIGLTSRAKMVQMNVFEPAIGFLTDDMARPENSSITVADMIHPRVECEIAFVMKHALHGPNCTKEQVLSATDFVLPAVEVIDSRFEAYRFDLCSVIADNSSSARFVTGGRARYATELDLRTLGVAIEINGEVVATGASAAVLGHPAEAIAHLVNILHSQGEHLAAGSFVMSGGITEALPVKAGDQVVARFQELGSVAMRFI
ncbi:2-oxo-3-hexenedioate decarboxylase [Telluria mixta]|uniref:2-oxo-3-hexenedioate decarboxylase n=1 Tax=Telluria mixta TaxID=34071 RepID=A0ABT2C1J7_9BURK|nr:2-oxo-3-hexenedioate decarboxylase [Telluria mixta]MCS0631244.1 2-oxo-3-hexenedioate decarboxylase [Telluria mixta]WEM95783.1 2-oxo-3-hexenedioate decarboxylase [Telluria mixta]